MAWCKPSWKFAIFRVAFHLSPLILYLYIYIYICTHKNIADNTAPNVLEPGYHLYGSFVAFVALQSQLSDRNIWSFWTPSCLCWKSVARAERAPSLFDLMHKHRLRRLMRLRLTAWIGVCALGRKANCAEWKICVKEWQRCHIAWSRSIKERRKKHFSSKVKLCR